MDIHLLKTLAAVAREGSVTRAAELLCLSQPAVSAHIKAMEETLEVALFERTPRGMRLTGEGARLLEKAEEALRAHRAVIDEAARLKGRVAGRLRLGAGVGVGAEVLGRFMLRLAERFDEAEAALRHGPSREIVRKIKSGAIDAGFHMEMFGGEEELTSLEIGRFAIFAVVAPELAVERQAPVDWAALSGLPWIYPSVDTCCGCAAEAAFRGCGRAAETDHPGGSRRCDETVGRERRWRGAAP